MFFDDTGGVVAENNSLDPGFGQPVMDLDGFIFGRMSAERNTVTSLA